VVLRYGDRELELYGGEVDTANNQMEMMAAIKALEHLTRPSRVLLRTDSRYLC
jgi:ribonuclease HI